MVECYPNVRLVLAGDGPERQALEHQVQKLGITNVVDLELGRDLDRIPYIVQELLAEIGHS